MRRSPAAFLTLFGVILASASIFSACGSTAPAPAATTAPAKPAATAASAATTAPAATKAAATVAPSAATTAPAAAVKPATTYPNVTIKFAHTGTPGIAFNDGVDRFAALVKERSGGAMTVQVFPGSQLGSEKDFVEQVKNGVIQMALTGPINIAVYDGWGAVGAMGMPYIVKGSTEKELAPKVVKLARSPLLVKEIGEKGAQMSGIRTVDQGWWFGERHITTGAKKQVLKPEDVKGLKIRTMDTPVAQAAMVALGAAATPMAVAELYSALQMGVVDGQENPLNIIYSRKFHEVQKYLSLTGHMAMNLVIIINDKFYQGLTPEARQLLEKAAVDAGDYQSDLALKANAQNLEDVKKAGMTVAEVDRAAFAEATKDAWKPFEATFGAGMYEKIRDAANAQ